MWYVYKKCNVYGEDEGTTFDKYEKALEYYNKQTKTEDVCRGYVTLYLFQVLRITENTFKDSSEYDFIPETCDLIKNKNPRIRLLSCNKDYGQQWNINDIGVIQHEDDYKIQFTVNGIWHAIYKGHPMYDAKYEII